MLEFVQGCAYVLSFMFFWTGTTYFDTQTRKLRREMEAAKKLEQMMQNKEFIQEYLKVRQSTKGEAND